MNEQMNVVSSGDVADINCDGFVIVIVMKTYIKSNPIESFLACLCWLCYAMLWYHGVEYVDDDEMIPKNASLIVRRVPAKNAKTSLIARLNNRMAAMTGGSGGDM